MAILSHFYSVNWLFVETFWPFSLILKSGHPAPAAPVKKARKDPSNDFLALSANEYIAQKKSAASW